MAGKLGIGELRSWQQPNGPAFPHLLRKVDLTVTKTEEGPGEKHSLSPG